ncbi:hypothetical protein ACFVRB_21810 [Streptomyces nojiriensis]|uniref:hypothetical protein n=1 Tax=Streptomyces nojiriensis TaxID=66374 RepID=UPI0036DF422B
MHRGLMLARSGDTAAGTAHARTALDAIPPQKHSLTLRLLMTEVERSFDVNAQGVQYATAPASPGTLLGFSNAATQLSPGVLV